MTTINQPINELVKEIVELTIVTLNMDISVNDFDPQAPLFSDGLGLDSIDILEISLAISKKYGCQLRSDHEDNVNIFSSISSLALYVANVRTK